MVQNYTISSPSGEVSIGGGTVIGTLAISSQGAISAFTGIYNAGTINVLTNSGSISGTGISLGIDNTGDIDTLTNIGTISEELDGIVNAGTIEHLVNSGIISSGRVVGETGIANTGDIYTLTNTGIISLQDVNNLAPEYLGIGNAGTINLLSNSGTISGDNHAISNGGLIETLTNNASISGPIANGATASLNNGTIGSLTNSGMISGGIQNGATHETNAGTIRALTNRGTISANSTGINSGVINFDTIETLTNNGSILGGIKNGATNKAGSGTIGTLTNSGLISGGGGAEQFGIGINNSGDIEALTNENGGTIDALTSGSLSAQDWSGILNTGTINTLTNSGMISGSRDGILADGTIYTLANKGTISGGRDNVGSGSSGAAIKIDGTIEALTNSGTISGNSYGIFANAGNIEALANSAWISGDNTGIYISAFNATIGTITNTGTISGGTFGAVMDSGTLINAGAIDGGTHAVSFFTSGVLVVEQGAVFNGDVVGNDGELELGTATSLATLSGIGSQFTEFKTISFAAGSHWSVAGTYTAFDSGETISGFTAGDTIILDGFTETGFAYVAGAGIELTGNGGVATSATIDMAGTFAPDAFTVEDIAAGSEILLCYLRGTRIATPAGEVAVEALGIGDAVITRFGGYRKIKWIGRQSFARRFVEKNFEQIPVRITAGALGDGLPRRDLFVSPGHSMLIDGVLVLAKSLVNGITITQGWSPEEIHYYQIEFETHDCVLAEGSWSESYADTPEFRAKFHNVAEFYALYPGHVEPEGQVLCAPRPLQGPALAAVLAPIVQRVPAVAGRLHGYIDEVAGGTVRGWAWDEANPFLPVTLEILLRDRVIGRVLACDYRRDLEDAGFGRGRCGFEFSSAIGLPVDAARDLYIRGAAGTAWVSLALNPSYGRPYRGRCMSNRLSGLMRA